MPARTEALPQGRSLKTLGLDAVKITSFAVGSLQPLWGTGNMAGLVAQLKMFRSGIHVSRVWQLVLNVWHSFPEEQSGPAGGDPWVFSALLLLLATGKHFPSLDFSFLSGSVGGGNFSGFENLC